MLIGLSIYHVLYCMLSDQGHNDLKALMPKKKDFTDFLDLLKFNFGLSQRRPQFDKFSFAEKFEYMAVVWGSAIMIATGLCLWFVEAAIALFPKWVLDIVAVIHSYEAILAFLAVVIWHFYNVHLNPEVFPMSKLWITGKISKSELMEHHPLEYERIMRKRGATSDEHVMEPR